MSSHAQVRLDAHLVRVGGDLAYEGDTERGQMMVADQSVTRDDHVTNV